MKKRYLLLLPFVAFMGCQQPTGGNTMDTETGQEKPEDNTKYPDQSDDVIEGEDNTVTPVNEFEPDR